MKLQHMNISSQYGEKQGGKTVKIVDSGCFLEWDRGMGKGLVFCHSL